MEKLDVSVADITAACVNDINFFAALVLPDVHTSDFPPEYMALFELLSNSGMSREKTSYRYGLGLPRGHAKTTFVKILAAWLFLFTHRRFILVACANESKAQAFCADVTTILSSPNIRALFGDWEADAKKNSASLKQFVLRGKSCVLQAVGAQGDPRGANIDFQRPDVQLCDDIQSRTNAKSETESKALYDWYNSTLYFTKAPSGVLHVFIGNMYPYEGSILKKLKSNSEYTTIIVGAILADGSALWPAIATYENLLADYHTMVKAGTPEIFLAEILNCANSFDSVTFSHENVARYLYADGAPPEFGYVIIDPATDSAGADATTIQAYLGFDGIVHLRKIVMGIFSPLETIKLAVDLAEEFGIYSIFIERVGYQRSLIFWANKYLKDNNVSGFTFYPIDRGNKNKNASILDMLKALQNKQLALHDETTSAVFYQISQFDPTRKTNKDDILDNMAYGLQVPVKYRTEITNIANYENLYVLPQAITIKPSYETSVI